MLALRSIFTRLSNFFLKTSTVILHFIITACSTSLNFSESRAGLGCSPGDRTVFFPVLEHCTKSCLENTLRLIHLRQSFVCLSVLHWMCCTDFNRLSTLNLAGSFEAAALAGSAAWFSILVESFLGLSEASSWNFLFRDLRECRSSLTSFSRLCTRRSNLNKMNEKCMLCMKNYYSMNWCTVQLQDPSNDIQLPVNSTRCTRKEKNIIDMSC